MGVTSTTVMPLNRDDSRVPESTDAEDETTGRGAPCLLGRVLFAAGVGALAVNTFRNLDDQIAYADSNGVPVPEVSVPASAGLLLSGSVGVALWRLPALSAGAVATFLATVTPVMHDYWNADEEEYGGQRIAFMKNLSLFGGAIVLLREALRD